jgi:hypothetical protein
LQFSAYQQILSKGATSLILRREVATSRRKIGVLRRGNQQGDATQIAPG